MALPNMAMIPSGYKPTKLYSVLPTESLGSENITNGDFSNGSTDWSLGSAVSVSNDEVTFTASGSIEPLQQGNLWTPNSLSGKVVKFSYTIVSNSLNNLTATSFRIGAYSGASAFNVQDLDSSVGTHSYNIPVRTSASTDNVLDIYISSASTTGALVLDNISVQEVLVGNADFDVTRATPATRVNQQGLIETPNFIESGELVTNGDFSNGTTDWSNPAYGGNNSATISIDNGSLKVEKNNNLDWRSSFVNQLVSFTSGKKYKIKYSLKNGNTSGSDVYIRTLYDRSASLVDIKTLTNDWVEYTSYYTADSSATDISFGILDWQNAGNGQYYFIDNVSIVEVERHNIPRLDYTDGTCPVLLTEPQSTNLIPYSEDFSQWSVENSSIVSNSTISPDGTQNATTWNVSAINAKVQRAIGSLTIGREYTVSFYIKAESPMNIGIGGIVTATPTVSVTTEWQRFEMTQTSSSTVRYPQLKYAGDLGTLYIWGGQLEELTYATSYIPTNGSAVTRNQDIVNNAGTSATYNSTEGVLFVEIAALSDDETNRYITITNGTSNERVALLFSANSSELRAIIFSSTQSINISFTSASYNVLENNKLAIRYKSGEYAFYINGDLIGTNTSSAAFTSNTLSTLSFDVGGGNLPFYGKTKQVQVFNTALSDFDLQNLTSNATGYATYETMRTSLNFNIQ